MMASRGTKRTVSPSTTLSKNVEDAGPFKYDEILYVILGARKHYLEQVGKALKTNVDVQWSTMYKWIVQFVYKDVADTGNSVASSTGNTLFEDVADEHAQYFHMFVRFFVKVCREFEKKKNEARQLLGMSLVPLPSTRMEEMQLILRTIHQHSILSQVYKYTSSLLQYDCERHDMDCRPFEMFMLITGLLGVKRALDCDTQETCKVLPTCLLSPKTYFDTDFFTGSVPVRVKRRHSRNSMQGAKGIYPPFLVMLKLALDCQLFEEVLDENNVWTPKRIKTLSSLSSASSSPLYVWGNRNMYKNSGIFVEVVYNAWCKLSTLLNVEEAEDILAPFIFCDSDHAMLNTVPKGRCLPADCMKELYTAESELDPDMSDAVLDFVVGYGEVGVPLSDESAHPLFRGMDVSDGEVFRGFARDFLKDLYSSSKYCTLLGSKDEKELLNSQALTKFCIPDGDQLPERFKYSTYTINKARSAIANVRLQRENEARRAKAASKTANCNSITDEGEGGRRDRQAQEAEL